MLKSLIPDGLERILQVLPNPSEVVVDLVGFDYSPLHSQAQNFVDGITFQNPECTRVYLRDPTKAKVLDIYRQQVSHPHAARRIDLVKAEWRMTPQSTNHKGVDIVSISPGEIHVTHHGDEPHYVPVIQRELKGTDWRLAIDSSHFQRRTD